MALTDLQLWSSGSALWWKQHCDLGLTTSCYIQRLLLKRNGCLLSFSLQSTSPSAKKMPGWVFSCALEIHCGADYKSNFDLDVFHGWLLPFILLPALFFLPEMIIPFVTMYR